jgi:hypothetical protein
METKRIWIREEWYDSRSAKAHLDHVSRTRTKIQAPVWEVFGDLSEEYLLAQTVKRTKPIKNRLFEVVTYIETLGEMGQVWAYLEEKLGRPVNCYCHFDEGADHVHFVCRVADDTGKALRLQRRDLKEINASIASLLGRQLSPPGTGRRQLSLQEVKASPESLRDAKNEFESTIEQIDAVMSLYASYGAVRIACRSDKGILRVQDIDPKRPVRDQLKYRRLKALNMSGSEILFAPVPQSTTEARVLYLDRVPEHRLTELPAGSVVLEISEHAYEAHIPVSLPMSTSTVAKAQRVLCGRFDSNRGSVAPGHYRRLPGFRHMAPEDPQEIQIKENIVCQGRAVSIEALRGDLSRQKRIQEAVGESVKHVRTGRTWRDFWDVDRDKADFDYAVYLSRQACSPEEIRAKVLAESEDLVVRKGGEIEGYLEGVVRRAGGHFDKAFNTE